MAADATALDGDVASADASADSAATDAPVTTTPRATGAVWPWALVALGGAMIAAAAVTGSLTLERQSELDAVCARYSCPPSAERAQAEGRALAFSTDVLGVGGLVVGAAGVVLALVLPGEPAPSVGAAAACGPEGCALVIGGTF